MNEESYTSLNMNMENQDILEEALNPHYNVVSIGDLAADVVVQVPQLPIEAGKLQILNGLQLEPGGAGNFLIAGSRLGLRMIALGMVGTADFFGSAMLKLLLMEGVDIHHVIRQSEGKTTTVFVILDSQGQHVLLGQYGAGKVVSYSHEWEEVVHQADWVQTWGYGLKEQPTADAMLRAMQSAKNKGIPVSFDIGPHVADLPLEKWKQVLSLSSLVFLTEDEIPPFIQQKKDWRSAEKLLELGVLRVCVKRGEKGCCIFSNDGITEQPGYTVTLSDSTGAGDAFAAGFVYASLHKADDAQAAAFANLMGTVKVQKIGSGRLMPTEEDIKSFMQEKKLRFDFYE